MKVRNGFVSNSSSSSFVIDKAYLTQIQIEQIKDHIEYAKSNFPSLLHNHWPIEHDAWSIEEFPGMIRGDTSMDNFDMYKFLEKIDVNMDNVRWN